MDQPYRKGSDAAAFRTCSLILLTVNLLLTGFVTYGILRLGGSLGKIFHDFGTELPWLAPVVLSRWYAIILPLVAAISVAKELLISNRHATLIGNGAQLGFILAISLVYVMGISEVLLQLIEKLSGGG